MKKLISIEDIQEAVAKFYRVTVAELIENKLDRVHVRPRQVAMSLSRELTEYTAQEIGNAFKKTGCTVLHAAHKVRSEMLSQENFKSIYEQLKVEILKL